VHTCQAALTVQWSWDAPLLLMHWWRLQSGVMAKICLCAAHQAEMKHWQQMLSHTMRPQLLESLAVTMMHELVELVAGHVRHAGAQASADHLLVVDLRTQHLRLAVQLFPAAALTKPLRGATASL